MPQESEAAAPRPALPMRLTRLRVKNFRSIADIDIPLSPLTVLVGPNGSGKSNVVDALRFVRDVFARGLDQAVMDREGMGVIQRWGTDGEGITIGVTILLNEQVTQLPEKIEGGGFEMVDVTFPESLIDYEFSLFFSNENGIEVKSEKAVITIDGSDYSTITADRNEGEINWRIGEFSKDRLERKIKFSNKSLNLWLPSGLFDDIPVFLHVSSEEKFGLEYNEWSLFTSAISQIESKINELLFYTLNPTDLRQPQQILKETPLDEKGRNLAAVLRRLIRANKSEWSGLRFTLNAAVVGFQNIAIEPVGGYLATKLIYQTDTTQPRTSYIGQESDGTIRMLGLLAALYQDPAQPFLSI